MFLGLGTTPLPPVLSLRHLPCPRRTRGLFTVHSRRVCALVCVYARARSCIGVHGRCRTRQPRLLRGAALSVRRLSGRGGRRSACLFVCLFVCGGPPQRREIVPRALDYLATPWSAQHSSLQALIRRQSGRRTYCRCGLAGWRGPLPAGWCLTVGCVCPYMRARVWWCWRWRRWKLLALRITAHVLHALCAPQPRRAMPAGSRSHR